MAKKFGLTDGELSTIKGTWRLVMDRTLAETAHQFNIKWWENDPQVLNVFPYFRGKSVADIRFMPRSRSHGTHIFLALDSVIRNLQHEEVALELIKDIKRTHDRLTQKGNDNDYRIFMEVALSFIASLVGAYWTTEAASAYKKVFTHLGKEAGIYK